MDGAWDNGFLDRVAVARKRMEELPEGKIVAHCRRSLHKLGSLDIDALPDSSNFGHFEALIRLLQHPLVSGICGVRKSFVAASNGSSSSSTQVDLMGLFAGKPAWMVVSDRNPKYVSWSGLRSRVVSLIQAAMHNLVTRPELLIFYFARGMAASVARSFEEEFVVEKDELHNEVEAGEWLLVDDDEKEELRLPVIYRLQVFPPDSVFEGEMINLNDWTESVPDTVEHSSGERDFYTILEDVSRDWRSGSVLDERIELVNLDTTALIGLVCGISNGTASSLAWCSIKQLQKKYSSLSRFIKTQALLELERPFLRDVAAIFKARQPMVSQYAWDEFHSIVSLIGGPNEKQRAAALYNCLKPFIVPNDPSERVMALPQTGRIHHKNKLIFGTGDRAQAPTLTSSLSFIRAVIAKGMALGFIEHRPLALTKD